MVCLTIIIFLLSIYVLFESTCAIADMPSGLICFCHKMKYVFAFSSSMAFMYYAIEFLDLKFQAGLWLLFGTTGTLAAFVWPRTIYRFQAFIKMLDDFKVGY